MKQTQEQTFILTDAFPIHSISPQETVLVLTGTTRLFGQQQTFLLVLQAFPTRCLEFSLTVCWASSHRLSFGHSMHAKIIACSNKKSAQLRWRKEYSFSIKQRFITPSKQHKPLNPQLVLCHGGARSNNAVPSPQSRVKKTNVSRGVHKNKTRTT